ncbi:MAG TPA: alpha/beta hydrolase [Anaerolineae bacterium]|nr:alpha/beta hydrolase [Anaerolineae bacterium]
MNVTPLIETKEQPRSTSRQRRILRWSGRGLKWLGMGIVAVLVLGFVFQAVSVEFDKRGYLPPGQLVKVNGHLMHIYCTGEGNPTVILEAGAYSYSTEWYWVQKQLSSTNRVCSYDRAGYGWSEPVAGSRDGLQLVHELHALLQAANIPGPYVMAGHSLGGVTDPIYAAEYPGEVLGMVLVDSAIPLTSLDPNGYEKYKSQNESAYWLLATLVRFGAARFIIGREVAGYGLPPNVATELTALKSTNQAVDTWDAEVRQSLLKLSQQAKVAEDFGARPLIILWAGHPELTAPEDRVKLKTIWSQVAVHSSNSVTRVIEGADHGSIQGNEQYAAQISAALHEVIASAQTGQPLTSE